MLRCGLVGAITIALCLSAAHAGNPGVKVAFSNCTEFAGEGYVPLAQAQNLVPAGYVITATSPGQAPIVVRMTNCAGVQVNRSPAEPTIISQIGINVVSPDGTGTINNYLLIYVTNNPALVEALGSSGYRRTMIQTSLMNTHATMSAMVVCCMARCRMGAFRRTFYMGRKPNRRPIVNSYSSPIGGLALP